MIIDISSYNGDINFDKLFGSEEIERVIMRSTLKSGDLDSKFLTNYRAIRQIKDKLPIDAYKFSYAYNFNDASVECFELIMLLKNAKVDDIATIWLDLEPIRGRIHTMAECAQIIAAYAVLCREYGYKLGIYCNYSYARSVIPIWARAYPMWLARWNKEMGEVAPFRVEIWQYSSAGQLAGIDGSVDLSRYVS